MTNGTITSKEWDFPTNTDFVNEAIRKNNKKVVVKEND